MAKEELKDRFESLKSARDEMKVQLNLGVKEVRDAWEDFEEDFKKLNTKMKSLKTAGDDSLEDLEAAARLLADQVGESIERLRKRAKT